MNIIENTVDIKISTVHSVTLALINHIPFKIKINWYSIFVKSDFLAFLLTENYDAYYFSIH